MTDFLTKINQLDAAINRQQVHKQTLEVRQIISFVKHKNILPNAPKSLGFLPNEVEEINKTLTFNQIKQFKIINQLFNSLRQFLSVKYGIWSLPNLTTADLIKENLQIKNGLEIMAGNGYWSKALSQVGVNMIATDSFEWSKTSATGRQTCQPIYNFDALMAIKKFTNVELIICSWAPNFTKSDLLAVKTWERYNPNSHLLFIGEKNGATNSLEFWHKMHFSQSSELHQINQSFSSFDFINEQVFEIKHEI
jgi:hypothetical protein